MGRDLGRYLAAFTVLHEIGHDMLRHPPPNTMAPYDARQLELAADAWAYRRMLDVGFSLAALHAVLAAESLFELERDKAGFPWPRQHPFWRERAAALRAFMEATPPVHLDYARLVGVAVLRDGAGVKQGDVVLEYPRDSFGTAGTSEGRCEVSLIASVPLLCYVFHRPDVMVLSGRTGDTFHEFRVERPFSHRPRIRWIFGRARAFQDVQLPAYPEFANGAGEMFVGGHEVWPAPRNRALRALDAAGVSTAVRERCLEVFLRARHDEDEALRMWTTGDIGEKEWDSTRAEVVRLEHRALSELLGAEAYDRYRKRLFDFSDRTLLPR